MTGETAFVARHGVRDVDAGRSLTRMRIEQLVDRRQDLVHRSILMQLLLNGDGRWPLRGDPAAR
jgi:hypothetical protein